MIAALKRNVAIWNINSFAEFYMQITEKYKKDYARSLIKIRVAVRTKEENNLLVKSMSCKNYGN